MAHMTLPSQHSEADALLAERIGQTLQLDEVHVFWTLPASSPDVAGPKTAEDGPVGLLGALAALGTLLERIGERIVSPRR